MDTSNDRIERSIIGTDPCWRAGAARWSRLWRTMVCSLVALGAFVLGSGSALAGPPPSPGPGSGLAARVAALEAAVASLQTTVATLQTTVANQQTEISALQTTVAEQAAILAPFSIQPHPGGGFDIIITGANLQIVNGLGATNGNPGAPGVVDPATTTTNGLGNLIVGYNEPCPDPFCANDRSGSHNVVVGSVLNFTRFGGIVAGLRNTTSGAYASVTGGGIGNTASGNFSSVSGGLDNTASGIASSVSGGAGNEASAFLSSVSGGVENAASGTRSSVSGGEGNAASGMTSSVSGGEHNTASGDFSSVSGGSNVLASTNEGWAAGTPPNTVSVP